MNGFETLARAEKARTIKQDRDGYRYRIYQGDNGLWYVSKYTTDDDGTVRLIGRI